VAVRGSLRHSQSNPNVLTLRKPNRPAPQIVPEHHQQEQSSVQLCATADALLDPNSDLRHATTYAATDNTGPTASAATLPPTVTNVVDAPQLDVRAASATCDAAFENDQAQSGDSHQPELSLPLANDEASDNAAAAMPSNELDSITTLPLPTDCSTIANAQTDGDFDGSDVGDADDGSVDTLATDLDADTSSEKELLDDADMVATPPPPPPPPPPPLSEYLLRCASRERSTRSAQDTRDLKPSKAPLIFRAESDDNEPNSVVRMQRRVHSPTFGGVEDQPFSLAAMSERQSRSNDNDNDNDTDTDTDTEREPLAHVEQQAKEPTAQPEAAQRCTEERRINKIAVDFARSNTATTPPTQQIRRPQMRTTSHTAASNARGAGANSRARGAQRGGAGRQNTTIRGRVLAGTPKTSSAQTPSSKLASSAKPPTATTTTTKRPPTLQQSGKAPRPGTLGPAKAGKLVKKLHELHDQEQQPPLQSSSISSVPEDTETFNDTAL
jgi:hypothetical protein